MYRRDFLKVGASGIAGALFPFATAQCSEFRLSPILSGWNADIKAIKRFVSRKKIKYLHERTSKSFQDSGKGRVVLLHKYLEKALGTIVPHYQRLGDCVGQGYGLCIDVLAATQIYGAGLAEKFEAEASIEVAYAGSRYEIGYEKHRDRDVLDGDGSWGVYAAEFVTDFGMLPRGVYGDVDLTKYNPSIARLWGDEGIPNNLEPKIKKHPIRTTALVGSYNEVRDAIVNGYPVSFCSDVGFNPYCRKHNPRGRDSMGFLNKCGTWYHCMAGIAVDDTDRPGVLLQNSWGPDWVRGDMRHGQPPGSFWVDAKSIDRIASQGDSYALSSFLGFPAQKLDYNLF